MDWTYILKRTLLEILYEVLSYTAWGKNHQIWVFIHILYKLIWFQVYSRKLLYQEYEVFQWWYDAKGIHPPYRVITLNEDSLLQLTIIWHKMLHMKDICCWSILHSRARKNRPCIFSLSMDYKMCEIYKTEEKKITCPKECLQKISQYYSFRDKINHQKHDV